MQNKCLRLIYKVKLEAHPTFNTDQLHVKGCCKPLDIRRDMHLLSYAFSLKNNLLYIDDRNLPTRQNLGVRLKIPRTLKPLVLRSSHYRAIMRWNELLPLYTNIEDLDTFKISIKNNYNNCFM